MRPKELYSGVLHQRQTDGEAFFQQYHKEFVDVPCPACGHEGRDIFRKYGFRHKLCPVCKTIFCSPRPPERLLRRYYEDFQAPRMWTQLLLRADKERKRLQYMPRVERLLREMKKQGRKDGGTGLDLGAGTGAFSLCLKGTGFFAKIIAVDLSFDCVKACTGSGLDAFVGTIGALRGSALDAIFLNDLIEHVFDPLMFLRECHATLRNPGWLAVATPNGQGFDFSILKEDAENITPPEHLNYFNPHSIGLLFSRADFRPVFAETPGKLDVDMVLKARTSGFPLRDKNEYINRILQEDEGVLANFQHFLSENGLSSHMLSLAIKSKG